MNYKEFKESMENSFIRSVEEIIEVEKLSGAKRVRHIVHQRFYLMWFLRKNTELSLSEIGELFDRDHATVMHGVKYHNDAIEINDKVYLKNTYLIKRYLDKKIKESQND